MAGPRDNDSRRRRCSNGAADPDAQAGGSRWRPTGTGLSGAPQGAPPADAAGSDATVDGPTDDTTVDAEIAGKVREEHGDEPSITMPAEDGAGAWSSGPTTGELGPTVPEELVNSTSAGSGLATPLSAAKSGRSSGGEDRAAGATSEAHQGHLTSHPVEREGPHRAAEEDGWADFDQSGLGWSLTGESRVFERVTPRPPNQEEGEGGQPRQNTAVYDSGSARSQPNAHLGGRLLCTAGQDSGRVYALEQREMTIGRTPGCSIILTDATVSREHARLLRDGDTYVVVDQRSANGTFINGRRIDRGRLRRREEVGFGSTRFCLLGTGDVFEPVVARSEPIVPSAKAGPWQRLRANPNFKAIVISVGMVAAAIVVAATIVAMRHSVRRPSAEEAQISRYFLSGVDAFKRRQWADARARFSIVVGLDPTHEESRSHLQEVAKEMSFERQLASAQASHEAGELAQAFTQAASIVDSVYTLEAKELMRRIDAELDARVARARAARQDGAAVVAGQADENLAEMRYAQGVEAYLAGRLPEAFRWFRMALSHDPDHGPSLQKLVALEVHAKEALAAGDRLKAAEPEQAKRLWRLVLQIVPSESEYFAKAKQSLDRP